MPNFMNVVFDTVRYLPDGDNVWFVAALIDNNGHTQLYMMADTFCEGGYAALALSRFKKFCRNGNVDPDAAIMQSVYGEDHLGDYHWEWVPLTSEWGIYCRQRMIFQADGLPVNTRYQQIREHSQGEGKVFTRAHRRLGRTTF